jgi:hypothetical protein
VTSRCDGPGIVSACRGDIESDLNCAGIGTGETCNATDGVVHGIHAYCESPDAACTPWDADIDVCDGDTFITCLAGVRTQVTCSDGWSCSGSYCVPHP